MPAILGDSTFGFELRDGGRIRGVAVGVDDSWRRMVRTAQRFDEKAKFDPLEFQVTVQRACVFARRTYTLE